MKVFFYGLFMDESLLNSKGIVPEEVSVGIVCSYGLRIGERATLVRCTGSKVYGTVMDITPGEATELYADDSVSDYIPESVDVTLLDGTPIQATCYNLPSDKITGTNKSYADSLLVVAEKLGFPDSYLDKIRQ